MSLLNGDNGTGKTVFLTKIAMEIKDRPIWSNFQLDHPNYKKLTMRDIINLSKINMKLPEYRNGLVVFIDEAYEYLEARLSGRDINVYLSHKTNYQWRKRLLDIYLTFQDLSSIDKRYRMRYHYYVECGYRDPFSTSDPFTYTFYERTKNTQEQFLYTNVYDYAYMSQYFKYYDTNEIIESPLVDKMEYKMIKDDPYMLKDKVYKDILPKLVPAWDDYKSEGFKLSKPTIEAILIDLEILTVYSKWVLPVLQLREKKLKKGMEVN